MRAVRRARRTKRKAKPSVVKMKQIAYAQASKLQKNRSELKFFINNGWAAGTSSSTTPGIADLSLITVGTTDQTRIGDEVYLRSFQFRYHFVVADSYNICRIIFFQWHQDDSPVAADILGDTAYPVLSPYRKDTKGHYTILYDKTHALDTYHTVEHAKGFISKAFKKKIRYDAGTTTGQNKLFFIHMSDSSAVTHPTLYLESQINYMDS